MMITRFFGRSTMTAGSIGNISKMYRTAYAQKTAAKMFSTREENHDVRGNFFDRLGYRVPLVMAPLVNPVNTGKPFYWPSRPAWQEISLDGRKGSKGIAFSSHGLSDQWDDNSPIDWEDDSRPDPNVGLGFEVVFGSMDLPREAILSAIMEATNTFSSNPFFYLPEFKECGKMERQIAQDFPDLGWLDEPGLGEIGTFSIEVRGEAFPDALVNKNGCVGMLIANGVTKGLPTSINLPAGKVHILEMVALHPDELGHIIACGIPARVEIFRRLRALSSKWCSSATRPSVVPIPPPPKTNSANDIIKKVSSWPLM
mmetsp:Transcript_18776/g.21598  ORF Transcript_18776/g.21598 Transcript_18776/m.21598 type:complete len:313 (+) Transcript_18776:51-989(+)